VPYSAWRRSPNCCRCRCPGFTSERVGADAIAFQVFVWASTGDLRRPRCLPGCNGNVPVEVGQMLEIGVTLPADTGKGGRATERNQMARPRYQEGNLVVRGRKRKRYLIRWREDVAQPDGSISRIRRAETIGFVSTMKRQEALEILQARVSAVSQQRRRPQGTMTLAEFVRAEWKPNAELALRKSSMGIYSFNLNNHILPAFGDLPIRDLGVAHVEGCLSKLKQKDYATTTLRSVRATFSTVLQSAVKRGHIEKNPAHGVCIRETDSKKERRFPSFGQTRLLLNELTEPCASVVSVAVLTGMRIGEILALRWKRIDLLGGTLEVAESYSKGEFGPPKTKSSRRVIPISSALRRVLETQHAHMAPETPDNLVFRTAKGTPLNDKNLYNRE